jgi:alpha-L-fucosidase
MISGRAGHNLGDYLSLGDMNIPVRNVGGLWETVDVTNDSWGCAWYDENWKSPKRILKSVISTVARGGTYMLNVGPTPDGIIPLEATNALKVSGEWIKKYPQVVYAAKASPWGRQLPWGDVTVNEGKLNLSIYQWPLDGKVFLPGLKNEIKAAKLWVDGKKETLETEKHGSWVSIKLPSEKAERLVSVIEVEIEGTLAVDKFLSIDPIYSTILPMDFAEAEGCNIQEKKWMEKFGEWKHISQAQDWTKNSKVYWEFDIMEAGYYQIDLNYAGKGRLVWRIENEEGAIVQNQQNSSEVYHYYELGLLKFEKARKPRVSVTLKEGDIKNASLKEIRFTPLKNLE